MDHANASAQSLIFAVLFLSNGEAKPESDILYISRHMYCVTATVSHYTKGHPYISISSQQPAQKDRQNIWQIQNIVSPHYILSSSRTREKLFNSPQSVFLL